MEKLPRQATGENKTKKIARQCVEPIIYSICGLLFFPSGSTKSSDYKVTQNKRFSKGSF